MGLGGALGGEAGKSELSGEEQQEVAALRLAFHLNISACCLKGQRYQRVVDECTKVGGKGVVRFRAGEERKWALKGLG